MEYMIGVESALMPEPGGGGEQFLIWNLEVGLINNAHLGNVRSNVT